MLVISGAGGHGRVIHDAAVEAGIQVAGFVDPNSPVGTTLNGCPVLANRLSDLGNRDGVEFIIALGSEAKRRSEALDVFPKLRSVIHPRAIVSRFASIGAGTFLAAGAIVAPNARIGAFCILNTACSVDHDCEIDDGVQICPGARLGGYVSCGEDVFIGTGANVIPKIKIGHRAIIGAGAVIIRDLPASTKAMGNPAHYTAIADKTPRPG